VLVCNRVDVDRALGVGPLVGVDSGISVLGCLRAVLGIAGGCPACRPTKAFSCGPLSAVCASVSSKLIAHLSCSLPLPPCRRVLILLLGGIVFVVGFAAVGLVLQVGAEGWVLVAWPGLGGLVGAGLVGAGWWVLAAWWLQGAVVWLGGCWRVPAAVVLGGWHLLPPLLTTPCQAPPRGPAPPSISRLHTPAAS
jgi:hypothetical protein